MLTSDTDTEIGRLISAYRVVGRLGVIDGAEIPLFDAEHLFLEKKAALRLFPPPGTGGIPESAREEFLERLRKLSRAKAANLLALLDVGLAADDHLYVVMERPEGNTLDQVQASLKDGVFPGARARTIAVQIAAAMQAAGDVGLGNRTLTARHIFLSKGGQGGDAVRVDLATAERLDATGTHAATDVQVLGRLLYQMVVGVLPTSAEDEAPLDPTLVRTDLQIPADLDAVIMRALDPARERRWADLAAMTRALTGGPARNRITESLSGHMAPVGAAEFQMLGRTFMRPSRGALVSGGVAAIATLGLVVAVVAARRGEKNHQPDDATGSGRPTVAAVEDKRPPAAPVAVGHAAAGDDEAPSIVAAPGAAGGPGVQVTAPSPESAEVVPPPKRPEPPGPSTAAAPGAGGAAVAPVQQGEGGPDLVPTSRTAGERPENSARRSAAVALAQPVVANAEGSPGGNGCAVTLGSQPWSEVWIDGKQAGFTPLIGHPVDCGKHEVWFKNSEWNLEKRISIVASPGHVYGKVVDLSIRDTPPSGGASPPAPFAEGPGATASPGLRTAAIKTAAASGASDSEKCLVTLGSRPWSEVWIDGQKIGLTPLVAHELPCGKHEVVLRAGESELEWRQNIVIRRGKAFKKVVALK